jgi:hypothetical protein
MVESTYLQDKKVLCNSFGGDSCMLYVRGADYERGGKNKLCAMEMDDYEVINCR